MVERGGIEPQSELDKGLMPKLGFEPHSNIELGFFKSPRDTNLFVALFLVPNHKNW